ncbi:MAG: TlpA disulfide reductase family protein [Pyrinomonadaceae bacterium]
MKTILALAILLFCFVFTASAQHEYAPLQEKEIKYKNWNYKSVRDDSPMNLRDFANGKKLVMVVYFAAWCPNWRNEAPFAEKLYEKYKANGFDVVGVSEYASVADTRANLDDKKITFPVVYESESKDAKQKTPHYEYRRKTGDTRGWGSPWNIFLTPADLKKKGDTLVEKTFIVNGELMEAETEAFIRQKLGLPAEEIKVTTAAKDKPIETCDADKNKKTADFKKP